LYNVYCRDVQDRTPKLEVIHFLFYFVSITQHLKFKVKNNLLRPFTVQKFRFV